MCSSTDSLAGSLTDSLINLSHVITTGWLLHQSVSQSVSQLQTDKAYAGARARTHTH